MTSINYNEFQAGQGVSAPALNENFLLINNAIENLETTLNSGLTELTSSANLKANKNGSSAEKFNVADAKESTQAVNLKQLNENIIPLSPIGTVIWYAGSSVPEGYLLCDGRNVSRTTYKNLFGIIGIKYGAGDSTTTFALPKLTDNRFIEGSSSVGVAKNAGLPNIVGTFDSNNGSFNTNLTGAFYFGDTLPGNAAGGPTLDTATTCFSASRSSSIYGGASTVQPKSLTLLPCIRY